MGGLGGWGVVVHMFKVWRCVGVGGGGSRSHGSWGVCESFYLSPKLSRTSPGHSPHQHRSPRTYPHPSRTSPPTHPQHHSPPHPDRCAWLFFPSDAYAGAIHHIRPRRTQARSDAYAWMRTRAYARERKGADARDSAWLRHARVKRDSARSARVCRRCAVDEQYYRPMMC